MTTTGTRDVAVATMALPSRLDMDDIAALSARLQRMRQGLAPYAVDHLRLHLIGVDGRSSTVVDDAGRAVWNAAGAGLAMRAWRHGHDDTVEAVAACATADPHFDLDDDVRATRRYVRLPATATQDDAVLELRSVAGPAPAHLCDLARALWYMQGDAHEASRPHDMRAMYRAQAIAAVDGGEATTQLTLLRPLFGQRALLIAAAILLLLPLSMMIPLRSSVNGEGTIAIANAPVQVIDRPGAVVALAVASGARVDAGQPLFWVEGADARPHAEAAYQSFANTVRERLLDAEPSAASQLPDRLGALRVAADGLRMPVLAATSGTVRELPRVGEVFERGARIGFVMPDNPVFELDAGIDPTSADALAVGDTGRVRVADGREWPVRVTRIDARARSATVDGRTRSRIGLRARLLRSDGLFADMPVEVQFDGRRMPVYRQLIERWGRTR